MKNITATPPVHRIGNLRILTASAAALLASFAGARGQAINISAAGPYAQNFNLLPTAAGTNWADNSTIPGWYARADTNATTATLPLPIGIYNGGSAVVSGFLSIGDTGNTERALGARPTTTNYGMVIMGALFRNTSGGPLAVGDIQYNGELWFTQQTSPNVDGFQFFYQISSAPITNLGGFTVNNGNTYAANAAVADPGWTRFAALDYSDTNAAGATALATPVVKTIKFALGVTLQNNEYLMLRWRNPNDTAGDAVMGIDDLTVAFTAAPKIYNLGHSVGGTAPNGVLAVSPNLYWLSGTLPVGLATGDSIAFSQDITTGLGTALITAPAAVTVGTITLGNTIGDYTLKTDADVTTTGFTGTGTRALRKTGTAAIVVTGPSTGNAGLIFDAGSIKLDSTTGGGLSGPISTTTGVLSTGGITVMGTGTGSATIGGGATDTTGNTYVGTTTVASGNLIANKLAGTTAIPGDLVVQAAGTFRYSGNTDGNQIADTSKITIDGGAFGDITAAGVNPTNPGPAETVTDVTLTANGGNFSSGRAVFTATGAFRVLAGKALAHRAGTITANEVEIGATGSIDLDGGSTTAVTGYSRLTVGGGGLVLTSGTINLNSHASVASATSVGSILTLNGDVTSVGTSKILDIRDAIMTAAVATVDLGGTARGFDVTGQLTIGSSTAPLPLTNGGVVKNGTGNLTITGSNTWTSLDINSGTVSVGDIPPPSPALGGDPVFGDTGSPAAVPEPGALSLLAAGLLGTLGRRARK